MSLELFKKSWSLCIGVAVVSTMVRQVIWHAKRATKFSIIASRDIIYGRVLTYRVQVSLLNSARIEEKTFPTGYFRLLQVRFTSL